MADGASLYAFISISIRTHFVFQAEIKITEAVPGRGSTRCKPCHSASWESSWKISPTHDPCLFLLGASCKLWRWRWWGSKKLAFLLPLSPRYVWGVTSSAITRANHPCYDVQEGAFHVCAGHREKSTKERRWCPGPESLCAAFCYGSAALLFHQAAAAVLVPWFPSLLTATQPCPLWPANTLRFRMPPAKHFLSLLSDCPRHSLLTDSRKACLPALVVGEIIFSGIVAW